jgi:hypothetical protein
VHQPVGVQWQHSFVIPLIPQLAGYAFAMQAVYAPSPATRLRPVQRRLGAHRLPRDAEHRASPPRLDSTTAAPRLDDVAAGCGSIPRARDRSSFAIPPVPQLAGFAFALQAVHAPTPSPFGFDLSNGVWARIGY